MLLLIKLAPADEMSLGINWSTSKMLQSTTVTATKLTDHLALVTGWSQGGHKGGHRDGHRVVTGWSCGGHVGVMCGSWGSVTFLELTL